MTEHSSANPLWDDRPVDVTREVNFIWSIANKLRGPYQSDKYKDVIIPMTIIRRFECALEKTKDKVVETYKANPNIPFQVLNHVSGFQFYNTSPFTLKELLNDPDHLAENFKNYLQGFSPNVHEILMSNDRGLDFGRQIEKMDKSDRLLAVVKAFSELDLDPERIDNVVMGYIFEDLIRRFSENAEAGDHYTSRDIVRLMVNLVTAEGCDDIFEEGRVVTILDQAAGTGGMLSSAYNYIMEHNPEADIRLYGQEINPESCAMCLAEMMIKGQDASHIEHQDTMKADCFPERKMRFVLENPPFGAPWKGKDAAEGVEKAVNEEHEKENSRFMAGLPGGGDMQMLFLQSAVDKMDDGYGRAVIVENGSPLFTGGTASGESQIRRYLLENDLIEAIVALPTDMFYNTGIATYLWVLSKNKRDERKGKIQLIDAREIYHNLRKSLGNKRRELTPEDRKKITELYSDFEENELCKIYDNEEFIYREYAVMQPLQRSYAITEERIENMISKGSLKTLFDEKKVFDLQGKDELTAKEEKKLKVFLKNEPVYRAVLERLRENISDEKWLSPEEFRPVLEKVLDGIGIDSKLLEKIQDGLSKPDKEAEVQTDRKGNVLYDRETRDTEIVKWTEDIDDYMEREVLPYVPDAKAFFEENLSLKTPKIRTGAEIPFTRYFYKYEQPRPSADLEKEFLELEKSVSERIKKLFSEA